MHAPGRHHRPHLDWAQERKRQVRRQRQVAGGGGQCDAKLPANGVARHSSREPCACMHAGPGVLWGSGQLHACRAWRAVGLWPVVDVPVADVPAACVCCRVRRVWCEEQREAICDALRVYHAPVSAITTDEHGFCWVASGGEARGAGAAVLRLQAAGCCHLRCMHTHVRLNPPRLLLRLLCRQGQGALLQAGGAAVRRGGPGIHHRQAGGAQHGGGGHAGPRLRQRRCGLTLAGWPALACPALACPGLPCQLCLCPAASASAPASAQTPSDPAAASQPADTPPACLPPCLPPRLPACPPPACCLPPQRAPRAWSRRPWPGRTPTMAQCAASLRRGGGCTPAAAPAHSHPSRSGCSRASC